MFHTPTSIRDPVIMKPTVSTEHAEIVKLTKQAMLPTIEDIGDKRLT